MRVASRSIGQEGGFSLLEVLVALIVVTIGLLGLAALQGRSLQTNHSAYLRTQATNLAYQMLDTWRANRGSLIGNNNLPADLDTWKTMVGQMLPSGSLTVTRNTDQLTVEIGWLDARWAEAASEQTTKFTVTSRI
ncbi:MAG TPA: type IV pilus modification protein PilV [Candidatus Competibacteraceae bacterium]|nr:type IV pilus modification protein PilV [Candidatus Competibacteraceae bacterium]